MAVEDKTEVLDGAASSLESRLRNHRVELDQAQTERFPVPRWGHLVYVELGVVSYKRMAKIAEGHRRVRDDAMRNLYIAADALLAATIGFYQVLPTGELEPYDTDWVSLARAAYTELDPGTHPRVAMLRLVSDELLPEFLQEWREWNRARGSDIDREILADLGATR